jgi:protein TonB
MILALLAPLLSEARQDSSPRRGDWTVISKVAPLYPKPALEQCISGWVRVGFALAVDGSVIDLKVMEAVPEGYFEGSALEAVKGNRYNPRIENGVPVEVLGMSEKLNYTLEDCEPHANT